MTWPTIAQLPTESLLPWIFPPEREYLFIRLGIQGISYVSKVNSEYVHQCIDETLA